MPTEVRDIVNMTIVELSQVPGVSTQVYASARILQHIQNVFDLCFQQTWWEAYTSYWTGTLNGTTGHLTADILPETPVPQATRSIPISNHSNIGECWRADTDHLIRDMPPRFNPTLFTGSSALYRATDYTFPNRPIKFYPVTSTDSIVMKVRQEPLHPFALTDLVYIDPLMLCYGAAYMYANDDGTNPGQVAKFQSLFMKRMNDMVAAENDGILQLDPRWNSEDDSGIGSSLMANISLLPGFPDISGLPTTLPATPGVWWNNGGVLSIS